MTKQEDRDAIKAAMANYSKPIRKVTEASEMAQQDEFDDYTEQSMRDGENRIVRNYHHSDGSVGPRQY